MRSSDVPQTREIVRRLRVADTLSSKEISPNISSLAELGSGRQANWTWKYSKCTNCLRQRPHSKLTVIHRRLLLAIRTMVLKLRSLILESLAHWTYRWWRRSYSQTYGQSYGRTVKCPCLSVEGEDLRYDQWPVFGHDFYGFLWISSWSFLLRSFLEFLADDGSFLTSAILLTS